MVQFKSLKVLTKFECWAMLYCNCIPEVFKLKSQNGGRYREFSFPESPISLN